jgi:proteasome assembly chaperone (PAC2) family protein
MPDLVERLFSPELHEPVMVVALEGWIDAGLGASNAMSALVTGADAETVAAFDADRLLDHRARRPIVHLVNGLITGLTWPAIELRAGTDAAGRDLLLLVGAEPDFEWQAFAEEVVDLAEEFEVRMMVTLGAYPAPVPHTREVNLAVTTSSAELSDRLHGYVRGTLDVPGGIHAVLDVAFNDAGIPAVGLWAQVPHYVSSMPYPAASVALLEGLQPLAGITAHLGQLPSDARATRLRLDELVADNPQHQAMVAQLEEFVDRGLGDQAADAPNIGFDRLPSGDELAAELQEFLRQRGDED